MENKEDSIVYFRDSNNNKMALLIKNDYSEKGIHFLTEDSDYQQVAFMGHDKGHVIQPHFHNIVPREIDLTCETIVLKKGLLKVDLFEDKVVAHSFVMKPGDILTLFSGGHGFNVLKDVEMVEIKQGPYVGLEDKTRF